MICSFNIVLHFGREKERAKITLSVSRPNTIFINMSRLRRLGGGSSKMATVVTESSLLIGAAQLLESTRELIRKQEANQPEAEARIQALKDTARDLEAVVQRLKGMQTPITNVTAIKTTTDNIRVDN